MKQIGVIFQKEILDSLRDYRSWMTALFGVLFGPLVVGVMIIILGNTHEKAQESLRLPVLGAENAPNLVAFLKQKNVIIEPAPADPRAAVMAGDVTMVLVIPKEYADDFSAGKRATVQLVSDHSRAFAMLDIQRLQNILNSYNQYIGLLRLSLRGISPEVTRVVRVETVDTATSQSKAMLYLSLLPYLIISAIFTSTSAAITDATAGERERGSLEPLLINPLPRGWVAIGKMLAAMPFAIAGLVITLAGFAAVFQILPVEELLGVQLVLDAGTLVAIFVIGLPIIFLACAIQTLIASFTRSVKEAGTYLGLITLVPSLPGLALALLPVKPTLWMMLIPTFGQQVLINQFLRAEPILASNLVISAVVTLAASVLITLGAIKFYENERIIG